MNLRERKEHQPSLKQKETDLPARKSSVERGKAKTPKDDSVDGEAELEKRVKEITVPESLGEWCHSLGIDDSLIDIKHSFATNSRGIFAKQDLKKGECILTVPSKAFISKKNVIAELNARELLPESCQDVLDNDRDALIVYFLYLRYINPGSPYYQSLPQSIGVFDEWDVNSAEYQYLLQVVSPHDQELLVGRLPFIKSKFDQVIDKLQKLFDPHQITFDDYLWARIQVTSRAMELPEDESLVVVPIIDFANHSYRDQNAVWDLKKDGERMGLYLLRDCPKGSEVFISYEKKDQFQMLCIYGFCTTDNPCEYLQFPPNIGALFNQSISPELTESEIEELMSQKGELLKQLRDPESFLIYRPLNHESGPDFNSYNPTNGACSDKYLAIMFLCLLDSIPAELSFETPDPNNVKDFLLYCQSKPNYDIMCMWIYNIMLEEVCDYISMLSKSSRPKSRDTVQHDRLNNIDILREFNKASLEKIRHVLEDLVDEFSKRPPVIQYINEKTKS